MLGWIWVVLIVISILFAILSGNISSLSTALIEGAESGVSTVLGITGMMMLWCGVMEVMKEAGLSEKLARALRPVLKKLFPSAKDDESTLSHLATNVSANLLGLGNAATPAGIRAAEGLQRLSGSKEASHDLCMLVVINTSSLQLIPTTVAAIRAAQGASAPFDILPAVWFATLVSQAVGILAVLLLRKVRRCK
ncbi:MAG: spore maturation protein A [Ruminococcaceae bacterium]|nr:spore maturation protein A [Oscillospiraceae bacterium]